ncbi:MAG: GTP-binding protein, partial [Alphaproteobacteria bacterium]|nr:GTP-binding protein [Alphaproteobacteria bacterium]
MVGRCDRRQAPGWPRPRSPCRKCSCRLDPAGSLRAPPARRYPPGPRPCKWLLQMHDPAGSIKRNKLDQPASVTGELMSDNVGSGPRTIALVGPYTSGKTTLLESMLFVAGAITRKGRAPDKNTTGDSSQEARERQMSVEVNAATFNVEGRRINVLDCPGSVEFAQETYNALMGVDLAVVVCEPQTERVLTLSRLLKFLDENGIPHMLFANRIDETTVRVAELVDALKPLSSQPFVACQVAIRDGADATGYVDLISGQAYKYKPHAASDKISAPDTIIERRDSARTALLESLADHNDALLERLLDDKIPSEAEIIGYL